MLHTQLIPYQAGETLLEGFCASANLEKKQPAVLVVHDWSGRNAFACEKAEALAKLGYVGFAVDMYGNAKVATSKEEKSALMTPLVQDRSLLLARIQAAFTAVKKLPYVDAQHIGIIGFCFGGLCALDLARSGAAIKGAVSFHGILTPPPGEKPTAMPAQILILHGYDDPMVKPDQILAFGDEMRQRQANWQFVIYGNTLHAFTNPQANDPGFGTVYNAEADKRSWVAMQNFFSEIFNR